MLAPIAGPLRLWVLRRRADRAARDARWFRGSPLVAGMLHGEAERARRAYEAAASIRKVVSK